MNILLYQNKTADALKIYLEHFGYNVTLIDYKRIGSFASISSSQPFDLIVLEELPELNCFSHLDRIGPLNIDTPKILLTSNSTEVFLINAIEREFAAIWFKPINPHVLFAQMKLLADPSFTRPKANSYIDLFEGVVYNVTKGTIEKGAKILISFTTTENNIFKILAEHLNRPVNKDDIIKQIGTKMNGPKNSRSFDVYLSYIRSKLKIIPALQLTRYSQRQLTLCVNMY